MSIHQIEITFRCGSVVRNLTLADLGRAFGADPMTARGVVLGLLLQPSVAEPSGEKESHARGSEGPVNVNGDPVDVPGTQENILSENVNVDVPGPLVSREQEVLPEDAIAFAQQLAEELGDPASLPWYRQVAETLSPVLIRDALVRARTVPAHQIRKSRAAYFTHIVTPFMRRARTQKPYAHAPSSTP